MHPWSMTAVHIAVQFAENVPFYPSKIVFGQPELGQSI